MFLSLKYHIGSLVAVFLALGLGILIGSALLGDDTLFSQQQQQLLNKLESRMESFKQKNESLRARIMQLEIERSISGQFEKQVLPALVGGKLQGRSLAIIATSGCSHTGELANTLKMAGASVENITVISPSNIPPGEIVLNNPGWQETGENNFSNGVAREISLAIINGDTRVLKILAGQDILKIDGHYGNHVSDLIIIGGGADKNKTVNNIDSHIIDFFKSRDVAVYGAEESSSAYSCIREYQKKGLTTVDNIETVPGQVSLVFAISGRPGQYGVKTTAKSLLPILEYGVEVNAR